MEFKTSSKSGKVAAEKVVKLPSGTIEREVLGHSKVHLLEYKKVRIILMIKIAIRVTSYTTFGKLNIFYSNQIETIRKIEHIFLLLFNLGKSFQKLHI